MNRSTRQLLGYGLLGYGVFAVINYSLSKATAGQLRSTTTPWYITLNDSLAKLNVLNYVLGAPTAPLAAGVTPVVTATDVVVGAPLQNSNVLPFPVGG